MSRLLFHQHHPDSHKIFNLKESTQQGKEEEEEKTGERQLRSTYNI